MEMKRVAQMPTPQANADAMILLDNCKLYVRFYAFVLRYTCRSQSSQIASFSSDLFNSKAIYLWSIVRRNFERSRK